MGLLDWVKGAWDKVKRGGEWIGQKVGKGLEWVNNNINKPVRNFAQKIPFIGDVVNAAQPIFNLTDKIPGALQGKGGLGWKDVGDAVSSVPGVIMAGRGAAAGAKGVMNDAKGIYNSSASMADKARQGMNLVNRTRGIMA